MATIVSKATERRGEARKSGGALRSTTPTLDGARSRRAGMSLGRMEAIWRSFGLSVAAFRSWTGYSSFADWLAASPRWSERQFAALVEENLEGIRNG